MSDGRGGDADHSADKPTARSRYAEDVNAPSVAALHLAIDPAVRPYLSRAGLSTCRRIGERWGLDTKTLARLIDVSTDVEPHAFVATDEQLTRLSLVLGIWKELASVFGPNDPRGHAYVRTEPELTTGGTVLEVMLSGIEGLWGIRRQLARMADEWQLMYGEPFS